MTYISIRKSFYIKEDGLAGKKVRSNYEDSFHNMWITTRKGATRIQKGALNYE